MLNSRGIVNRISIIPFSSSSQGISPNGDKTEGILLEDWRWHP